MKIVEVTWLDAGRTEDTVTGRESIGIERRTVGWLMRDDEEGVIVAFSDDGEAGYERAFLIPRAYVRDVRRLS